MTEIVTTSRITRSPIGVNRLPPGRVVTGRRSGRLISHIGTPDETRFAHLLDSLSETERNPVVADLRLRRTKIMKPHRRTDGTLHTKEQSFEEPHTVDRPGDHATGMTVGLLLSGQELF